MKNVFIFMLFVLNLIYVHHAMAFSQTEQTIIFNEEGNPDDGKGGDENPEEDCE